MRLPCIYPGARLNRSDLIRVPAYREGKESSVRIEYRAPDPACNPFLTFSVLLAGGLEGIEKEYPVPEPVEQNVYQMSPEERQRRGIGTLPGSLWEAVQLAEKSELVRNTLGDHVFKSFIQNKKIEWESYHSRVSDYEIKRYLPVL